MRCNKTGAVLKALVRLAAERRAYRTVAGLSSIGSSCDDKRHNRRCHCLQLAMRCNLQRIVLRIADRKNQLPPNSSVLYRLFCGKILLPPRALVNRRLSVASHSSFGYSASLCSALNS